MTLPQVEDQFEYWKSYPPAHERIAIQTGYQRPLSIEEQWAQGAMGPADFAVWVQMTDGKRIAPDG